MYHYVRWRASAHSRLGNLSLNRTKTKEIIFRTKGRRGNSTQLPATCPGIERVKQLTAAGVINDQMTAAEYVSKLLETCTRWLYVLCVLRQHGLSSTSMNDVFRATVLAKLLYCASSWSSFCLEVDRERLNTYVRRCKRLRYSDVDIPEVAEMSESADVARFSSRWLQNTV